MEVPPVVNPSDGCPNRNTLAAFNCGRLSEPEMEQLAEHVGTCARCESTLQELMLRPADSFEAGLLRVCAELPTNHKHAARHNGIGHRRAAPRGHTLGRCPQCDRRD